MADPKALPPGLREGRRALEGLEGSDWSEPQWRESEALWAMPVWLTADFDHQLIPKRSAWWVLIDNQYPAGTLDVYPAKDGGIVATFQHQSFNQEGPDHQPWRTGRLCLETSVASLNLTGCDHEPRTSADRLLWKVQRLKTWLHTAATEQLARPGDPFELPDYRFGTSGKLAFFETLASLETWANTDHRNGYARLRRLKHQPSWKIVTQFESTSRQETLHSVELNSYLQEATEAAPDGVWIRLDEVPVVEPWQAPSTWAELVAILSEKRLRIEKILPRLLEPLRDQGADSKRHCLLVGFPISAIVGGSPQRMFWTGFDLPRLAGRKDAVPGFRNNKLGHWKLDEQQLRGLHPLPWLPSENWGDTELTGRGHLPFLAGLRVLLLGCGALGSAVAELLVRGGVRDLSLIDGETLEAGNLVRHSLDMADLGRNKAEAVRDRLLRLSPHVRARAFAKRFEPGCEEQNQTLAEADLVINTTANHSLMVQLEQCWNVPNTFVSLSLGLHAQRLYLLLYRGQQLPRQPYVAALSPWLEDDWKGVATKDLPRDGLGCWNPLMPATHADITLLAAVVVKELEAKLAARTINDKPRFQVFEQKEGIDGQETMQKVHDGLLSDA